MNLTIDSILGDVMPLAVASGLFASLCNIQAPSGQFDSGGAPLTGPGAYVAVAGLQCIVCMSAPVSTAKVSAGEAKTLEEILGTQARHVLLSGCFPQIPASNDNWQAVISNFDSNGNLVDVATWDIMGSESSSQSDQTRLEVRVAQI